MRDCPTVEGSSIPLIVHRIAVADCLSRQSCNYHKCHRCVFRGKAAGWQPEGGAQTSVDPGERLPARTVELPRPQPGTSPRKGRKGRRPTSSPV
ncbi:MAG: hypothetical protein AB7O97_11595 [Planctomycetota bacterium]